MTDSTNQETQQLLQDYYEKHMADGQCCYFELVDGKLRPAAQQRLWLEAHRQKSAKLLALEPSDSFVDIGCGEGYLTLPLAQKAKRTVGFDLAASALTALRAQQGYDPLRIMLAVSSGDNIPLADATVDKLLCNHVLEHVIDDDAFVQEFHRVVRPGGLVLIGVPQAYSPQVSFLIRLRRIAMPGSRRLRLEQTQPGKLVPELIGKQSHIRFYSLSSVRDLLERNGFRVLRAEGVGLSLRRHGFRLRRYRFSFKFFTAMARIFPSIGDGVLVLAQRK